MITQKQINAELKEMLQKAKHVGWIQQDQYGNWAYVKDTPTDMALPIFVPRGEDGEKKT